MTVTNEISCEERFKADGNTKWIPVLRVSGQSKIIYAEKCKVKLQMDSGDIIEVEGYDLIKAIKNAMNC